MGVKDQTGKIGHRFVGIFLPLGMGEKTVRFGWLGLN